MIEFFSGIGGMRLAVEEAVRGDEGSTAAPSRFHQFTCRAYDISLHANRTYQHNFPNEKVTTKLVEQLKAADLDGVADLWTMSPPCQPFTTTRGSKGLDQEDKRCNGFKSIMQLLTDILRKPRWIMLENVKGFATSKMIRHWKDCLQANGYSWKEYLISPMQIGIPNHRLRYYILCDRSDRWNGSENRIVTEPPAPALSTPGIYSVRRVGEYLEKCLSANDLIEFIIKDEILQQDWATQLGVVSRGDSATHCFTAGYGRILHRASGSLLLMEVDPVTTAPISAHEESQPIASTPLNRSDMLQYSGRLRRFTPREILAIFGFPPSFSFPEDLPLEHQYKLIGNSINVTLVSLLAKELLFGNTSSVPPTKTVGGINGHVEEEIDGNLLTLFNSFRWKMIPNCTGRYICRDHNLVSALPPLDMLSRAGIECHEKIYSSGFGKFDFALPGRADKVEVVPLDHQNLTGIITFVKEGGNSYVHTLNTPSGFRRKLQAIGIKATNDEIVLESGV